MTSVPYMTTTPTARTTSRAASCTKMAAALPRKMPAGSRPDRRRASRPPSADSIVKARWMASRLQNSTATQKRPALARVRIPRSGSRATPKRMSTRMAKGATCCVVTCERSSTRRSLPAISVASRNKEGLLGCAGSRGRVGGASHDRDDPVRQRLGPVELVRRQEHGGPGDARRGARARRADRARPGRARRAARRAATAPGGGPGGRPATCAVADRPTARATGRLGRRPSSPHAVSAPSMSSGGAPAARPQKRTLSVTVSSSYRPVAWPRSPTRRRRARAWRRSVRSWPSTRASPRASGRSPAQSRKRVVLPGPVRPAEEHDLSGSDLQVDPGQCGEPAQERHRAVELDDGFHGSLGSLRTALGRDQGDRARR